MPVTLLPLPGVRVMESVAALLSGVVGFLPSWVVSAGDANVKVLSKPNPGIVGPEFSVACA